uniref:Uncharacterized protein n=1 Tax=Anguilla anguilla TaxID=7936 RepID=A0A0E9V6J3_ANGAN
MPCFLQEYDLGPMLGPKLGF